MWVFVVPIVLFVLFRLQIPLKLPCAQGANWIVRGFLLNVPVLVALDFPCVLLHLIGPSPSFHPRHRLPQRAAQCEVAWWWGQVGILSCPGSVSVSALLNVPGSWEWGFLYDFAQAPSAGCRIPLIARVWEVFNPPPKRRKKYVVLIFFWFLDLAATMFTLSFSLPATHGSRFFFFRGESSRWNFVPSCSGAF